MRAQLLRLVLSAVLLSAVALPGLSIAGVGVSPAAAACGWSAQLPTWNSSVTLLQGRGQIAGCGLAVSRLCVSLVHYVATPWGIYNYPPEGRQCHNVSNVNALVGSKLVSCSAGVWYSKVDAYGITGQYLGTRNSNGVSTGCH